MGHATGRGNADGYDVMITFQDANGNPLPAAVRADFYAGSSISPTSTVIESEYIQVGGGVTPSTLTTGTYTVSFYGTWAPTGTVTISYNSSQSQTVTVTGYQSPTLSQSGFALAQAGRWVRGAFGDSSKTTGGIAYNLAFGLSYALLTLSQYIQQVFQAMRLPTSVDTSIDTWAKDFFGGNLPRLSGESNAAYISRIKANLSAKKGLRDGIETIASYYGTAWINEPWRTDETGSWDTNGTCAWDQAGGWGDQKPLIQVFVETNPGLSTAQLKSDVLASRAAGIRTQVVNVVAGANGEGWGVAGWGAGHFGVQSQNDGTVL